MMDIGLLILRLVAGLTMAGHGAQKLFGWFGGHGVKGTGGFFESIGIRPGAAMAVLAGAAELVGGLLFAAGVWTAAAAALIIITMLVAMVKVHAKNGYWVTEGGIEYTLMFIAIAVAVALTGPGAYTLF